MFVKVTFCAALVVPFTTLPKASVAGETVTAATPVPESAATCGLLGALSITVICPPLVAPVAVGAKSTPMTQLCPAASAPLTVPPACGQVVTALVSSTKGPLKTTPVKFSVPVWLFVIFTVLAALVVPTTPLPKEIEVGESTTDAIPVAESGAVLGLLLALVLMVSVPAG